jgi:hypothetical protein
MIFHRPAPRRGMRAGQPGSNVVRLSSHMQATGRLPAQMICNNSVTNDWCKYFVS